MLLEYTAIVESYNLGKPVDVLVILQSFSYTGLYKESQRPN